MFAFSRKVNFEEVTKSLYSIITWQIFNKVGETLSAAKLIPTDINFAFWLFSLAVLSLASLVKQFCWESFESWLPSSTAHCSSQILALHFPNYHLTFILLFPFLDCHIFPSPLGFCLHSAFSRCSIFYLDRLSTCPNSLLCCCPDIQWLDPFNASSLCLFPNPRSIPLHWRLEISDGVCMCGGADIYTTEVSWRPVWRPLSLGETVGLNFYQHLAV